MIVIVEAIAVALGRNVSKLREMSERRYELLVGTRMSVKLEPRCKSGSTSSTEVWCQIVQ